MANKTPKILNDYETKKIMGQSTFELTYVEFSPNQPDNTIKNIVEVVIPDQTMTQLNYGSPVDFYHFYINEGSNLYVSADCIISIRELNG